MKIKDLLGVFIGILTLFTSQIVLAENYNKSQNDQDIIVVSSKDDAKHLSKNEVLSLKFNHSLNLATKKKIKAMAIEEFKALAKSKGYTHLYIDEATIKPLKNEIKKRDYTIVVTGTAYK